MQTFLVIVQAIIALNICFAAWLIWKARPRRARRATLTNPQRLHGEDKR